METKSANNYPIKYAIVPILEPIVGVAAYIVTKCYVVSEIKRFKKDGTSEMSYEVVLPYQENKCDNRGNLERQYPNYNYYHQCTNYIVLPQLYDDHKIALEIATKMNKEILDTEIYLLLHDEKFEKRVKTIQAHHQFTVAQYKKMEKIFEENTRDMKVKTDTTLESNKVFEKTGVQTNSFYIK